mgnify:CR=1 FL=1
MAETLRDPFQILTNLSQLPTSGLLTVFRGDVYWEITITNRQLMAAVLSIQSLDNLYYHLQRLGYKQTAAVVKRANSPDNPLNQMSIKSAIHWLQQQNFLNADQVSQVMYQISREALEPFFWLNDANFYWEEQPPLTLSISNPPQLRDLVKQERDRLQSWQDVRDQVQSPYQRPYLFNQRILENPSHQFLAKISKLMRGLSLHEIALIIKQDEIKLAKRLYPYLEDGVILLREPKPPWNQLLNLPKLSPNPQQVSEPKKENLLKIACIDDSPTILREMQRFLGEEEYEIIKIDNPVEAASTLFRIRPNLVLLDISMPEVNGYKLCSLLRNSNTLSNIPIIMVTSRTGMIDKVRAKASGATDYLVKPFTQDDLLEMVNKYL